MDTPLLLPFASGSAAMADLLGRIGAVAAPQVGGLLLAAGLGVNSNFLAFAGAAAVAAVLLGAIGIKINSKTPTSVGAHNV